MILLKAAVLALVALSLAGCTQLTARTDVDYTTPDGRRIIFGSDREYQDLKLRYVLDPETGKVKEFTLEVGNAGSPSGLAASALQQNLKIIDLFDKLTATGMSKAGK